MFESWSFMSEERRAAVRAEAVAKLQKETEEREAEERRIELAAAEVQAAMERDWEATVANAVARGEPRIAAPRRKAADKLVSTAARNALLHTPAGFAWTLSSRRWHPAPHLLLLSEKLSALAAGKIKRLIVQSPPRHGKSQLCSTWFPLWYLHHFPRKRVALASYSADLAAMFGRQVRNLAQDHADKLSFRVAPDSSAADRWELVFPGTGRRTGGMMVTTGAGGPLTGKGADCLPKGSIISTEGGPIDISVLASMANPPRVLSFNHKTGNKEWRKIVASREISSEELIEICTSGGRKLRATSTHRFFVQGEGYKKAISLQPGDRIVSSGSGTLRGLRREEMSSKWFSLPEMLFRIFKGAGCYSMVPCLPEDIREKWECIFESFGEGARSFCLLKSLFGCLYSRKESKSEIRKIWRTLRGLWDAKIRFSPSILFQEMSVGGSENKGQGSREIAESCRIASQSIYGSVYDSRSCYGPFAHSDTGSAKVEYLHSLRGFETRPAKERPALRKVLSGAGEAACAGSRRIELQHLWQDILQINFSAEQQKELQEKVEACLLLEGMCADSYHREESQRSQIGGSRMVAREELSHMWRGKVASRKQILLQEMYGLRLSKCRTEKEVKACASLSGVRSGISKNDQVLFWNMCQFGTLQADAGRGELSLQRRRTGQYFVEKNQTVNSHAGFGSMRSLRKALEEAEDSMVGAGSFALKSGGASCRREQAKQHSRESNNAVPDLSRDASQICTDTVSMVRRIRCREIPVYDIQVEGNCNFFANEILVHNCLIVDDPHKNAEEANSLTMREKIWEWWQSTAYTRLEPGGVVCLILTRWHQEDLAGKILQQAAQEGGEHWEVVRLPAVCEEQSERDEAHKSMFLPPGLSDPLGRKPGEALWPDRYTAGDFKRIKSAVGSYVFSALYMQTPKPAEGNIFKKQWFPIVDALPVDCTFVLYFDKAGTEGGQGAQTAGVLMARAPSGRFFVVDCVTGRWSAAEREAVIKQTLQVSEQRFGRISCWVEQEPGSGGKESAENTIINLAGYDIHADRPTGDKVTRAAPFAAQAEVGNVALLAGAWNYEYLEELAAFPHGLKDRTDASSAAFNKLALGPALPFGWMHDQEPAVVPSEGFMQIWPTIPEEEDRWRGFM